MGRGLVPWAVAALLVIAPGCRRVIRGGVPLSFSPSQIEQASVRSDGSGPPIAPLVLTPAQTASVLGWLRSAQRLRDPQGFCEPTEDGAIVVLDIRGGQRFELSRRHARGITTTGTRSQTVVQVSTGAGASTLLAAPALAGFVTQEQRGRGPRVTRMPQGCGRPRSGRARRRESMRGRGNRPPDGTRERPDLVGVQGPGGAPLRRGLLLWPVVALMCLAPGCGGRVASRAAHSLSAAQVDRALIISDGPPVPPLTTTAAQIAAVVGWLRAARRVSGANAACAPSEDGPVIVLEIRGGRQLTIAEDWSFRVVSRDAHGATIKGTASPTDVEVATGTGDGAVLFAPDLARFLVASAPSLFPVQRAG